LKLYGGLVSSYTIGEVADRSGFSASALRYYEGIGLVAPSARTGGGYRLYDDQTLARLAFIARAKQLGCALEEITDLATVWDGEQCGPVQHHFHELVTAKINEAGRQMAELAALVDQLRDAAAHLAGPPTEGPCDETCACASAPASVVPVGVATGTKPDGPPIACTLDASSVAGRAADWQRLLATASTSQRSDGSLRVAFGDPGVLGELAGLVAAELACCAFFTFVVTLDQTGVELEVRAPAGAEAILHSLVGAVA
jgi:DNA-binding transcriptional MerR regulator